MARINTNVPAIVAQRHLSNASRDLNSTIARLSSGVRITRGADDPAGLIASERLRSEISAVNQAIQNTQRASNIIATTEGALDEVANLLNDIQELIIEAANTGALSEDEIRANQLQIDSAIASITRISNSTTFAGRQLLNGSLDYVTSGVNNAIVQQLEIHGAQFGTQPFLPVNVDVMQSAQPGMLFFTDAATGADTVTVEIAGNTGVTTLNFVSGTPAADVLAAINLVRDATGVSASFINPANPSSGVMIRSLGLGSRQFVKVNVLSGTGFTTYSSIGGPADSDDDGRDAVALINGAAVIADGNRLAVRNLVLDLELTLANTFGEGTTSFAITKGGAMFQVGPEVNSNLQVNIGMRSVAATRLGSFAAGGFMSQIGSEGEFSLLKGNASQAQNIVKEAIRQVSVLRGRLGAFEKNTLDTNVSQLTITMENLSAAESAIRDADFAYETSQLSRNQILVNSSTAVLALAQQTPQSVLRLLG
ncbi:MAG: flagellin [Phycisphaerae bacterium]|nr:flagellin [Phycisphaerae bacterium]MCZ2400783.1 flagellin [Phycisphaerae bacterium]NUQ49430.1 flagellin [Phycisphaerae bacterium]